jgi:hypothetical protein
MSELLVDDVPRHTLVLHGFLACSKAGQQRSTLPPITHKGRRRSARPALAKKVTLFLLLVVMAAAIVHVPGGRANDAHNAPKLPDHVADVRDAILTAAHSGKIEELKSAFEVSGAVPDLGISSRSDPIKALKDRSADPQGRDTLAAIVEIMEMPPAALPLGNDIENNLIYVWPYLSMRRLDSLTPSEQVDLYRLVPPELAADMLKKKRWLWWRLVIAADGTWTMFKKGN